MAQFTKSDRYFVLIILLLFGVIAGVWYMLHPDSPRFVRNSYFVLFEEVGTLNKGDPVRVNGLLGGEVKSVVLTGDGWVKVELGVLEAVEIPSDSRFKVVNTGLVGERIVELSLGRSAELLPPGGTVLGGYDPGATRLAESAGAAIGALDTLFNSLFDVTDQLLGDEMRKRGGTLVKKIARDGTKLGEIGKDVFQTGEEILRILDETVTSWEKSSSGIHREGEHIRSNFTEIGNENELLMKQVRVLRQRLERLLPLFSSEGNGSVARFLHEEEWKKQIDSTLSAGNDLLNALRD